MGNKLTIAGIVSGFFLLQACTGPKQSKSDDSSAVSPFIVKGVPSVESNLKAYAMCECLDMVGLGKDDNSLSLINNLSEYTIHGEKATKLDSLVKIAVEGIRPSQLPDDKGRKPMAYRCLELYNSPQLDSVIKSFPKQ